MNRTDELIQMNELLLEDQPQYREQAVNFPQDQVNQRRLMRSLMNVRMPHRIPVPLKELQDQILSEEREEKKTNGCWLPATDLSWNWRIRTISRLSHCAVFPKVYSCFRISGRQRLL